jgi:DNA repair exonuclease SbcCD ATPase subunit
MELSSSKDALASKQSHLTSLLSELAKLRQKQSTLNSFKNDQSGTLSSPPPPSFWVDQTAALAEAVTPSNSSSPILQVEDGVDHSLSSHETNEHQEAGSTPASLDRTEESISDRTPSFSLLDLDFGPPSTEGLSLLSSSNIDLPLAAQAMGKEQTCSGSDVPDSISKPYTFIVMDETGSQFNSLELSEEDKEREKALKKFYEARVDQLMSQVKEADRKAVDLHAEYAKAVDSLASLVTQRDELQGKLTVVQNKLTSAKDELESTRRNYEQQMKVFSEHIVTLNDKILAQEEEITKLRTAQSSGYPAATRARRGR